MSWIDDIANEDFIKGFNEQANARHQQQQQEEAKIKEVGNGKGRGKRRGRGKATNPSSQQQQQQEQQNNEEDKDKVRLKEHTVFKHSKDIPLAEEVTIHGVNMFLQIIDNDIPHISESIDLSPYGKNIKLVPHQLGEGSPIFPYEFANTEEVTKFIKLAQAETIDSLFLKHKSIWNKIVYADKKLIGVLAIDSLYSHFQDKFSTTHYEIFIGPPDSGKGAILLGLKYLGYRVVVASYMSGANLLDLLGSTEPCQVTIAEDELDNIHDDPDKLRITKVGYDNVGAVPRTLEGNTSSRHERWFNPFCFKIYAAEESPDAKKLEGFNDRTFKHYTITGKPTIYAKKLSEDTDSKDYNEVKSRIDYLRKLTLIFRLIHHKDIIEEVDTNLQNRALELTEPQLRLFNSDRLASTDKKVLKDEVSPVLSYCLRERNILAKKTLEAAVYQALESLLPTVQKEIVLDTVSGSGNEDNAASKLLTNEDIYNKVKEITEGTSNIGEDGKEHSFYSVEYGKVSDKRISKICRDKFHAKDASAGTGNNKKRALRLDEDIVNSVGHAFNVVTEIEVRSKASDAETVCSLFDNDDDSGLWDDYLAIEHSTSQSGTQGRKKAYFEGNKDDNKTDQNQARISHDNDENNPLCPENNPSQNDDKKETEQSSSNSNSNGDYWSNGKWRERLGSE
jgi:hypothetical protein